MEESAMTTRIGGKVTSSYGEVSASTACDDKTMQTNTQQVGSKVTRGKVRNVACPYARHRELGKKELKLLTTNKHVDETERQILLNSRPLNVFYCQNVNVNCKPPRYRKIGSIPPKLTSPPSAPPPPPSNT